MLADSSYLASPLSKRDTGSERHCGNRQTQSTAHVCGDALGCRMQFCLAGKEQTAVEKPRALNASLQLIHLASIFGSVAQEIVDRLLGRL